MWWSNLYMGKCLEQEWCLNIRMSVHSFMELVDKIRDYVSPATTSFRSDTITAEKRVAIVLYYLKDQGSFRMTINTFGISMATMSLSVRRVCQTLRYVLDPELIKFPVTKEEVKLATTLFEQKFSFPQVIGLVDGTHIPIQRPTENSQDFFCYKMKHSLNVMAICDHKGYFIDVDIRWPGSVHDARVFHNSYVKKGLVNGTIPNLSKELVPGLTPVPAILIGDPAYPLLPNVMNEFTTCTDEKQLRFNTLLRASRNQIECSFGRLKGRWRILNRAIDVELDLAINLIYSCFILHNFCEKNKEELNPDVVRRVINNERIFQNCEHHNQINKLYAYNSARGKLVRQTIVEFLNDNNR